MQSKDTFHKVFAPAILAGAAISIGCVVFLRVGGVAGAVLFAFGLLTCVHFKLPLYTGTAGFVMDRTELGRLFLILVGNIVGCFLMAVAMKSTLADISDLAGAITVKRAALQPWQILILSCMCGFIMTTAVKFARVGSFLPLLFGVPVFILCGFVHSIADAFYILASPGEVLSLDTAIIFINYVSAVAGNFVGCNLYRIICLTMLYPE
ncbi:MAG: formate/nitrite transporter family protein [Muribaculaceae bacterium]|nr:formate/nitrite transporter family protein [Muribaculaceae bacterium]